MSEDRPRADRWDEARPTWRRFGMLSQREKEIEAEAEAFLRGELPPEPIVSKPEPEPEVENPEDELPVWLRRSRDINFSNVEPCDTSLSSRRAPSEVEHNFEAPRGVSRVSRKEVEAAEDVLGQVMPREDMAQRAMQVMSEAMSAMKISQGETVPDWDIRMRASTFILGRVWPNPKSVQRETQARTAVFSSPQEIAASLRRSPSARAELQRLIASTGGVPVSSIAEGATERAEVTVLSPEMTEKIRKRIG